MRKSDVILWLQQPHINRVLLSFSVPKTPKQVEKELGIKKLKIKPFLEKRLIKPLNPVARKGRLYVLTNKAKRLLKLPSLKEETNKDWDLIGWIMASPKQRFVVLKVMDSVKRTSENIRVRASRYNSHLTRISTKQILKELMSRGLIETEMTERRRCYLISEKGKLLVNFFTNI